MENSEKAIEKRKEGLKNWLKNPYNLTLVGILILAFGIRLYYFILTKGQTLWWDEAEYMSTAKYWAFGIPYDLNPQRPPLFQFLGALAFMTGLGEQFIKFAFVLLPSVFLVFAIYLLGKNMFDEKIGLIAAFLTSVSWTFVFWTARVQPDFFSMTFSVLAVLFMWEYWKNNKSSHILLAGFFAALGFYFKVSGLLVPMIFMVFILLKDRLSAFKIKEYYYFAGSFLATLIPYFIWSYITFGTATAFTRGYVEPVPVETPFGWYNIQFYSKLTTNGLGFDQVINSIAANPFNFLIYSLLLILLILGVFSALKFILYIDILAKDKKKCIDPALFSILALFFISAFYIFHIKNTDDRWVFLWMPFIFFLIGKASIDIYEYGKKYSKILSLVLILILLAVGGYGQLKHADGLINNKKDSYMPVKIAGEWIKENSDKADKVLSISYTQSVYYTERNVSTYSEIKPEDFDKYIEENKPRFLQISVFEPHPDWISSWVSANQDKIKPVQAYFGDAERKNAILVIYEISY